MNLPLYLFFARITKMNIPVSPSPSATGMSPYSRVKPDQPAQDDPYWSSDVSGLCLVYQWPAMSLQHIYEA